MSAKNTKQKLAPAAGWRDHRVLLIHGRHDTNKNTSNDYATISLSVNWAAGIGGATISLEEIGRHLTQGMTAVLRLVGRAVGVALSR